MAQNRKLGRVSSHRKAMLRNLATDVIMHGKIETTEPKAREVRRVVEKMITLGKQGNLHAYRQALAYLTEEDVAKKLEEARSAKTIGHSLNAKVIMSAKDEEYRFLQENKELLMTVFIVSGLEVVEGESDIKVEVADGEKCERCWMYSTTVGEDEENPTICSRCSEALK